jgi:hypothetical protein
MKDDGLWYPTVLLEGVEAKPPFSLVATLKHWDVFHYMETVLKECAVYNVIAPPYNTSSAHYTSQAALMARRVLPVKYRVGVRAVGRNTAELAKFCQWAEDNGFFPIVLELPFGRWSRELYRLYQLGALRRGWYHCAGLDHPDVCFSYEPTLTYGCAITEAQ